MIKMFLSRGILLVFLGLCASSVFSSDLVKGNIKGKVIDIKTKSPLEYVNIALFRTSDSLLSTGGITTATGEFSLENIESGTYYLRFSFIGFKDKIISDIQISSKNSSLNLDTVFLQPSDLILEDFTIEAERSIIENNLDKKVFNVEKDVTTAGGTAMDVMKNIPGVSIDSDGNISLRGSGNVNILIDGKPSSLSAAQILEQIPANMIESVELITNPSAKYDPDGMSGIINIVTKKLKTEGYNGTINLNAGTRNKYTATAMLNYRVGKINLFGSYDVRYTQRFRKVDADRDFVFNDTTTSILQHNNQIDKSWNHTGKLGIDFYINDFNTLSLSSTIRKEYGGEVEDINYYTFDYASVLSDHTLRDNVNTEDANNLDFLLNYTKKFKQKGREWTFDASYSDATDVDDLYAREDFIYSDYLESNATNDNHNRRDNTTNIITIQTDYVHPTEKYGRFEMGIKSIIRKMDTDLLFENYEANSAQWINDTLISNTFNYSDQIFSSYFIYANAIKKWQYQIGIRAEQTFTESYQVTINETYKNDYFNLFPSVHLKRKLKKDDEMAMNYSRRINRPGLGSLNPFPDYNDPLLLRMGNPKLQPEFVNSFELSYMRFFKKWTLSLTSYYRNTSDVMIRFRDIDSSGVTRVSQLNLAKNNTIGLDFVMSFNPTQKLKITLSGGAYYFTQTDYPEYFIEEVENFNYNAKINTAYTVKKGFDIQVSGFYHAPMLLSQGTIKAMYSMDFGLKKDLLKGKANFNIRFSDIFNTQRFWIITESPGFYLDTRFKRETQVLYVGFTYKLNGGSNRKVKEIQMNEGGGGEF